ncbi:hypothetical protein BLA29_011066, partial [Euroglyphus maynei]
MPSTQPPPPIPPQAAMESNEAGNYSRFPAAFLFFDQSSPSLHYSDPRLFELINEYFPNGNGVYPPHLFASSAFAAANSNAARNVADPIMDFNNRYQEDPQSVNWLYHLMQDPRLLFRHSQQQTMGPISNNPSQQTTQQCPNARSQTNTGQSH